MSATYVETDMRSFEGSLDEEWCHTCDDAGRALCGFVTHTPDDLHPWVEPLPDGRCPECGLMSCPECDLLDEEDDA